MFHEDIYFLFYRKYIKTRFLISNMHCLEHYLDNFKGEIETFLRNIFSQILSNPNKPFINGKLIYSAYV